MSSTRSIDDKPYDQFVREQIAGDLLPAGSEPERDEQLVATGFLALGVKDVNQRFKVRFIMDNVDEQIDAVSRAVLGLTASCARCHDHKFDPIPTADYYALAGIFRSTDLCAGLRNKMGGGGLDYYDTEDADQAGAGRPAGCRDAGRRSRRPGRPWRRPGPSSRSSSTTRRVTYRGPTAGPGGAIARQKMNRAQNQLLSLTDPAANGGKVALGVRDAKTVGDTEIRIRGEAEKLGPDRAPRVPRRPQVPRPARGQSPAERPARAGAMADRASRTRSRRG